MIRWFLERQISAFEKAWHYDASYARDILDADPGALWLFSRMLGLSRYRKDVPLPAYYAARITAAMAEDCGPCIQLAIDMAERAGVDPSLLRAVVAEDFTAMNEDAALGARFANATLKHRPEAAVLREEILRRWGKRALLSLGFAITSARLFPTIKYALGHSQACQRLSITDQGQSVRPEVAHAT